MRFLIAIILAGCSFDPVGVETPGDDVPIDAAGTGDGPAGDDAPAPTTRFRKAITVPSSSVSGALTDFPIYVELTEHANQSAPQIFYAVGAEEALP